MPSFKQLVLKQHCGEGLLSSDLFDSQDVSIPETLKEGQFLVKLNMFSCDPTQRIWATNTPQYMDPVKLGEVMRSGAFGTVVKSNNPNYSEGDTVTGLFGWREYAVLDATSMATKTPSGVPAEIVLGPCGLTGVTAYAGLFFVGKAIAGETVVVSGASGATGSAVVQLAKIAGCKVIGIAGGPEKCKKVVETYGADSCIDYKSEDVAKRLQELTECNYFDRTGGIDVYFDNVGGDILNAALQNIAAKARVVICGAISGYTKLGGTDSVPGPSNYINLLLRRGTMQGFIVTDYLSQWPLIISRLSALVQSGKLKYELDIAEGGLSDVVAAVNRLLTGHNQGKQLFKLT